ncbi:MAG: YqgE/AlgH family protein [Alphaproteobacteria bacterium]
MRAAGGESLTATARRALLALVLFAVPAAADGSAVEEGGAARGLRGEFLVATPDLLDPNFARTVVLVIAHDDTGAMGLVVNRSGPSIARAELLGAGGGATDDADALDITLHYGGPVGETYGFMLHDPDYADATTEQVADGIALSVGADVVGAIGSELGPRRYKFLLGYAGWGPGQLEDEIAEGAWVVAPADAATVLGDDDDEAAWQRALARRYLDL